MDGSSRQTLQSRAGSEWGKAALLPTGVEPGRSRTCWFVPTGNQVAGEDRGMGNSKRGSLEP